MGAREQSGGTTAAVRNPLAGLALTILGSLGLSFLVAVPILFLPQRELLFVYMPFALFGVGYFSGRTSFLGSLGFTGAIIGGFVGIYLFQFLFLTGGWPMWPAGWEVLMTLGFGGACGLGGFASGKLGLRRIERLAERGSKMRRCHKCGAKVGAAARKCWSCRAYLPPT